MTEHASDNVDAPESFDPVELATEADAAQAAREARAASGGEPAAAPETAPAPTPAANLLERALRAAGSDAARYLPVRFVPALTSLITTPLFTRAIDKADYGAFYLISAVASLLSSIAIGWLNSSSVRFYWPSRKSDRLDAYTSTIVWTGLTSLLACTGITALAVYAGAGSVEQVVMRLIPAAIVYTLFNFYTSMLLQVLRAANRASVYTKLSMSMTVLVTAISIGLVWWGHWGANGILMGAAIGNLVVLPFIVRAVAREGSLSPRHVDRELLGELFSYGMPLVPVGVAGWALIVLDRFVIGHYRSAAEVGVYAVAYGLADKIMQLATQPLLLTMTPSLTQAYETQGQKLAEQMQSHFTRYFALLTLPMLVGLGAASRTFMDVFTGPQYRSAFAVLPVVAAGSMLGSLANIAGTGLGMHKRTKLIMGNTVAAAAFNLGLNVMLVPRFGYMAAAWDTLAAYSLLLLLTWAQSRRYMRWLIPWGPLARVAMAAAGMGAAVYGMSLVMRPTLPSLLAEIVAGVVAYPLLLMVFGGVRPEERAFLGELGRRALARVKR